MSHWILKPVLTCMRGNSFSTLSMGRVCSWSRSFSRPKQLSCIQKRPASLALQLVLGNKWIAGSWDRHFTSAHIILLESYPLILATKLFWKYFANHCLVFMTDNFAVVDIINTTTSENRPIMKVDRQLVLFEIQHPSLLSLHSWLSECHC